MTSLSLRTAILSGFGALAERATTNPMRRRRGGHFALHGLLGPLKSLLATIVWFAGKFLGKSSLPLPCEVFFAQRQRQNQSVKVSNRELTYMCCFISIFTDVAIHIATDIATNIATDIATNMVTSPED